MKIEITAKTKEEIESLITSDCVINCGRGALLEMCRIYAQTIKEMTKNYTNFDGFRLLSTSIRGFNIEFKHDLKYDKPSKVFDNFLIGSLPATSYIFDINGKEYTILSIKSI